MKKSVINHLLMLSGIVLSIVMTASCSKNGIDADAMALISGTWKGHSYNAYDGTESMNSSITAKFDENGDVEIWHKTNIHATEWYFKGTFKASRKKITFDGYMDINGSWSADAIKYTKTSGYSLDNNSLTFIYNSLDWRLSRQ